MANPDRVTAGRKVMKKEKAIFTISIAYPNLPILPGSVNSWSVGYSIPCQEY